MTDRQTDREQTFERVVARFVLCVLHFLLYVACGLQSLKDLCGDFATHYWPRTRATHQPFERPPVVGLVLTGKPDSKTFTKVAQITNWLDRLGAGSIMIHEPTGLLQEGVADFHQALNAVIHWSRPRELQVGFGRVKTTQPEPTLNGRVHTQQPSLHREASPTCSDSTLRHRRAEHSIHAQPAMEKHLEPLHIILLSAADSHQPLSAAANLEEILNSPDSKAIPTTRQLGAEIEKAAGKWAAQQTDVMLVTGPCSTLAGFPPWSLQFTQIYHLGLLPSCSESHVRQAMHKFASTKQRFGK